MPLGATIVIRKFPLGVDRKVDLRLERFEVFTENAKVVVGSTGKDGSIINQPIERPDLVLFRGHIDRDPDAHVFLAFGEHATNGFIDSQGSRYIISKHPTENWTAVYNMTNVDPDLMNWSNFQCEVEDISRSCQNVPQGSERSLDGDCDAIQLAIDTDWEFTKRLFGGNVQASTEYAATLIGAVSSVYKNDISVWSHISYLRLWGSNTDPWTSTDTAGQLPEFREYWESNMQSVSAAFSAFT